MYAIARVELQYSAAQHAPIVKLAWFEHPAETHERTVIKVYSHATPCQRSLDDFMVRSSLPQFLHHLLNRHQRPTQSAREMDVPRIRDISSIKNRFRNFDTRTAGLHFVHTFEIKELAHLNSPFFVVSHALPVRDRNPYYQF